MLIPILALLLAAPFADASTAKDPAPMPDPEVGYSLQARVYLQDDGAAKASLEAFGPGWVPSGRIDWQPIIDDVPAWLGRQAFPAPSTAIGDAFAQALRRRLPTVQCEARSYLPLGSPEIGVFALECSYPDVSALRVDYLALRKGEQPDAQARSNALFSHWTTTLREASGSVHCVHVTGWHQGSHESTDATRARQLSRAVLTGLIPLDAWDAGEDGAGALGRCEID